MTPRSLFRLALVLLSPGVVAAQATVFQGTPGGTGDVLVFDAPGSAFVSPVELRGVRLLPCDAAGRSAFTQFQPDQPRLKSDLPLATRILLPQNQGSLYRFRRDRVGGADFGFFIVRPNGKAAFLVDFPGSGPSGTGDPIPNPVAIAPAGDAFLVATTLAAGGDIFEVSVATGALQVLTAGRAPLDVKPQGLVLLPTWGAALTSQGPLRFARGGSAVSVPLAPKIGPAIIGQNPGNPKPPALTSFGNGFARSADGSTVALIAGTSSAQSFVYTFRLSGSSVRVNENAAPIVDPGFGTQGGPTLAVSTDGSRVAWKTNDGASGECFSRKVPTQPTTLEEHVTGDQNFADTLNETGVIAFFDPKSVVMLVGEPNGIGGVEKADIFRATFTAAGTTALTNLSKTSGDTQAPFLTKGIIDTAGGMYQIPGQAGSVYFSPSTHSLPGEIVRLDEAGATTDVLRSDVASLDFVERAGDNFVLGFQDDVSGQRELLKVPFNHALAETSLGVFSSANVFTAHTGNLAGTFAGVMSVTGGSWLEQVFVPTGASSLLSTTPFTFGPALGFDGSGAVLASLDMGARSYYVSWPSSGGPVSYQAGVSKGIVLPAN